jgi:hypothetical protein
VLDQYIIPLHRGRMYVTINISVLAAPAAPFVNEKQTPITAASSQIMRPGDSGRPDRFRMDPHSGAKMIQEIDPATGNVIAEYSVDTFPALAKSLGLVGSLVDSQA